MTEKAPVCPISHSQDPVNPRGMQTRLPAIPVATDLASLIRAVNIIRDILRTLTTSLTINNTYLPRAPRPPRVFGSRLYIMSPWPDWEQRGIDTVTGYVGKNPKNRAYVNRINKVEYKNKQQDADSPFIWEYLKPLTGEGGGGPTFNEDYFERLVSVKWKPKTPSGPSGPPAPTGPPPPVEEPGYAVISWHGRAGPSLACVFFGYSQAQCIREAEAWILANGGGTYTTEIAGRYTIAGLPANTVTILNQYYTPFNPPRTSGWMVIVAAAYDRMGRDIPITIVAG